MYSKMRLFLKKATNKTDSLLFLSKTFKETLCDFDKLFKESLL